MMSMRTQPPHSTQSNHAAHAGSACKPYARRNRGARTTCLKWADAQNIFAIDTSYVATLLRRMFLCHLRVCEYSPVPRRGLQAHQKCTSMSTEASNFPGRLPHPQQKYVTVLLGEISLYKAKMQTLFMM